MPLCPDHAPPPDRAPVLPEVADPFAAPISVPEPARRDRDETQPSVKWPTFP
jgi:hypothetical protein